MMINASHIAEALDLPYKKASNLLWAVALVCKIKQVKPTNNPRIKLVPVKHFDIDEAIEAISKQKVTKVNERRLNELHTIKAFYAKL